MFTSIRAFFLTIVWIILALPYGIDAPTRAFIEDCSLNNGAVVCEQTANGAEATFTLRMVQDYRPIMTDHAFNDFEIKVFRSNGSPDLNKDIAHSVYEWPFVVIGNDEDYPPVQAEWSLQLENDPLLIRVGDKYTVIVHVTFPKSTAPGTYSIAVSPNYAQECLFLDALTVN